MYLAKSIQAILTIVFMTFFSCSGSVGTERAKSGSAGNSLQQKQGSGDQSGANPNSGAWGSQDGNPNTNMQVPPGNGGLGDLIGQAGEIISNLGNNNNSTSTSTDTATDSGTDTGTDTGTTNEDLITFKFSEFSPNKRAEKYFTTYLNGPVQGESPHGKVQIYYPLTIEDMVGSKDITVPVGTVAVKVFDNDGNEGPDGLAIMIKQKAGYDPDGNDWYYELKNNTGATIDGKKGIVAACKGCHGADGGKDFDYLKGLQQAAGM